MQLQAVIGLQQVIEYCNPSQLQLDWRVWHVYDLRNSLDYLGIQVMVWALQSCSFSRASLAPEFGQFFSATLKTLTKLLVVGFNARGMSVEEVDSVAGRVWIGEDAIELGETSFTVDDAVVAAAELAELENYDTFYVQRAECRKFSGRNSGGNDVCGQMAIAHADSALVNEFKRVLKEFSLVNQLNDPKPTCYVYLVTLNNTRSK